MLLHDLVTEADPYRRALVFGNERWTFPRLASEVARVATAVAARTAPGDRVGTQNESHDGTLLV